MAAEGVRSFGDDAPMTTAAATEVILMEQTPGAGAFDTLPLDERVPQTPEQAYEAAFYASFAEVIGWPAGVSGHRRHSAGCGSASRVARISRLDAAPLSGNFSTSSQWIPSPVVALL